MSYCPICKKDLPNPYFAPELFTCCLSPEEHKSQFIDTGLLYEEAVLIRNISEDISFLEAMIDLKQKDPIEFQLKMSQFKSTQNQTKAVEENSGPHCPYCSSTDLKKISGLSKAGSVALWGIFAVGKVSKQWHCNSCKSDF